jgi:hypothetical protein
MPMQLRIEPMPDNPHCVAFLYGPVVLCGELKPEQAAMPVVCGEDGGSILKGIRPAPGKPLTFTGSPTVFRTLSAAGENPVKLIAFYKKYAGPYTVYWDVCDAKQWGELLRRNEAELAAQRAVEARTIDRVLIGNQASEQEHKFAGERTGSGLFDQRAWRDAAGGGWFAYELKVDGQHPLALVCAYWGSDCGNRQFDVLVDGAKIATQKLDNNRPYAFFDETYAIPPDLTKGKDHVTVRFQGLPGQTAGGIFGLRVVKK